MKTTYPLSYRLDHRPEGIPREQIERDGLGAADAVILISIIRPEDGSLSTVITSLEGATGQEISDIELFKAWTLMAKRLSESKTLEPGKKALAGNVFEDVRQAILRARGIIS
jgi:hypothetical protein